MIKKSSYSGDISLKRAKRLMNSLRVSSYVFDQRLRSFPILSFEFSDLVVLMIISYLHLNKFSYFNLI